MLQKGIEPAQRSYRNLGLAEGQRLLKASCRRSDRAIRAEQLPQIAYFTQSWSRSVPQRGWLW
jgi:hypothetical protein